MKFSIHRLSALLRILILYELHLILKFLDDLNVASSSIDFPMSHFELWSPVKLSHIHDALNELLEKRY